MQHQCPVSMTNTTRHSQQSHQATPTAQSTAASSPTQQAAAAHSFNCMSTTLTVPSCKSKTTSQPSIPIRFCLVTSKTQLSHCGACQQHQPVEHVELQYFWPDITTHTRLIMPWVSLAIRRTLPTDTEMKETNATSGLQPCAQQQQQ